MPEFNHILIVSADEKLREELLTAIASLGDHAPTPVTVATLRQGIESARNRAPDVVIVEMNPDLSELREFALEIAGDAPHATISAVFRPELFDVDTNESEVIIDAMRAGVKDFLRRPISSAELADLLLRHRREDEQPQDLTQGHVISFIANKGGVGKSTLSVNTAVGLALRHPERVLLIDASLQMGVAASMLDIEPRVTLADVAEERSRLDVTMLRQMVTTHESGLHLLAAPSDAVEALQVDDEVISRIITLARRSYDYVVVDTFPMFDRVVVAILDLSDLAYVVVENVVPTVKGAAKMLQVLENIGFAENRRRVVLNRMTSITGGLSAIDVAERLNCTIHCALPYDKKVIAAANTGRPYVMTAGRLFNRFAMKFKTLVDELDGLGVDLDELRIDTSISSAYNSVSDAEIIDE